MNRDKSHESYSAEYLKAKLWYGINTAEKYKMDFFLVYGMEIPLAQPNVSLIKLASSSRGIIFVLFG